MPACAAEACLADGGEDATAKAVAYRFSSSVGYAGAGDGPAPAFSLDPG